MFESDIPVVGNDWNRGEDVVHVSLSVGLGIRGCQFDPHDQFGDCDCRNCYVVVFVDQIVEIDSGSLGVTESSMAKVAVSEALFRIADNCVQVMGGTGLSRDTVVELVFREVRAFRVYDGPTEVHKWSLAKKINDFRSGRTTCCQLI